MLTKLIQLKILLNIYSVFCCANRATLLRLHTLNCEEFHVSPKKEPYKLWI